MLFVNASTGRQNPTLDIFWSKFPLMWQYCREGYWCFQKISPQFHFWSIIISNADIMTNFSFPPMCVYGGESTRSPFIPFGICVMSDVPVKLLPSIMFRSVICLEYVKKIQLLSWICERPYQRQLIESETSHWLFISCISVTWVSPRPHLLRRQEAVLSPFILMEKMNVITDYDRFFCPIVTKIDIGPIFHKTHIFWTFWHKNVIFQTHKSGENLLF